VAVASGVCWPNCFEASHKKNPQERVLLILGQGKLLPLCLGVAVYAIKGIETVFNVAKKVFLERK
jgi:hypothetical protein